MYKSLLHSVKQHLMAEDALPQPISYCSLTLTSPHLEVIATGLRYVKPSKLLEFLWLFLASIQCCYDIEHQS